VLHFGGDIKDRDGLTGDNPIHLPLHTEDITDVDKAVTAFPTIVPAGATLLLNSLHNIMKFSWALSWVKWLN